MDLCADEFSSAVVQVLSILTMRWGVIIFPGSCDDHDVFEV